MKTPKYLWHVVACEFTPTMPTHIKSRYSFVPRYGIKIRTYYDVPYLPNLAKITNIVMICITEQ